MAQWRVEQCSSTSELLKLASSSASDTRYFAASKLVALEDASQGRVVRRDKGLGIERFLKEQHVRHGMDWQRRSLDETMERERELALDPTTGRAGEGRKTSSLFPQLTGLASFSPSVTSASAQISLKLAQRLGNNEVAGDPSRSTRAFSASLASMASMASPEDDRPAAVAERRRWREQKRANLEKLFVSSVMGNLTYDDPTLQPGSAFWRHVVVGDDAAPALGHFMPDSVATFAEEPNTALVVLWSPKLRRTEQYRVPRDLLASADFHALFLGKTRKQPRVPLGQPLFVLKRPGKPAPQLLSTTGEAEEAMRSLAAAGQVAVLQRYVRASGRSPWLVRLVHCKNGTSQVFTLTSKTRFPQAWTVESDPRAGASECTNIVFGGGLAPNATGVYETPCQVARVLAKVLRKEAGLRLDKVCLEFVRTQTGKWFLVNIGGFGGATVVRTVSPARSGGPPFSLAHPSICSGGAHCERRGAFIKTSRTQQLHKVMSPFADTDEPVSVCTACHRAYTNQARASAKADVAAAKERLEQASRLEDSHDPGGPSSTTAKKKKHKHKHKHKQNKKETGDEPFPAAYSLNMLATNSPLYAAMIKRQRAALRRKPVPPHGPHS